MPSHLETESDAVMRHEPSGAAFRKACQEFEGVVGSGGKEAARSRGVESQHRTVDQEHRAASVFGGTGFVSGWRKVEGTVTKVMLPCWFVVEEKPLSVRRFINVFELDRNGKCVFMKEENNRLFLKVVIAATEQGHMRISKFKNPLAGK